MSEVITGLKPYTQGPRFEVMAGITLGLDMNDGRTEFVKVEFTYSDDKREDESDEEHQARVENVVKERLSAQRPAMQKHLMNTLQGAEGTMPFPGQEDAAEGEVAEEETTEEEVVDEEVTDEEETTDEEEVTDEEATDEEATDEEEAVEEEIEETPPPRGQRPAAAGRGAGFGPPRTGYTPPTQQQARGGTAPKPAGRPATVGTRPGATASTRPAAAAAPKAAGKPAGKPAPAAGRNPFGPRK